MLLVGCKLTTKDIENGYLSSYQNLTTHKDTNTGYHQRWVSREMTRKVSPFKPQAVYLAPVIYYPQLEQHQQIDYQAATKIQQYLDMRMKTIVSQYFPISTTKGKDVLVIEPAITAVKISLEDLSPLEVIPFRAVISAVNLSLGGRDRDVEIRLEAKIKNGFNDRLLATTVHGGQGLQIENSSEKLSLRHLTQLIESWCFAWDQQLKAYKRRLDENA
ncbi:DUF3313 domain-containing protein [Pseudoalteromonas sp. G4]|uniref:DUF3313 domain-containing protein n=1 Tax=Pseudoalteromonas sp. G4 TaxID=2992761 RepID=UPI00237D867B|nr:DUF3313 domain-containing protein [Pseudoalteromonas sp. G4]MDE3273008.1 DUF3313 domain-containing protein [Pseudoalteromonas sp. G4]